MLNKNKDKFIRSHVNGINKNNGLIKKKEEKNKKTKK